MVKLLALDFARLCGKGITANRAAIRIVKPHPTPFANGRVRWVQQLFQTIGKSTLAGSQKEFTSGPGEFVIGHEIVAVMRDLLIRALATEFRNRVFQKGPTFLCLF